MLRTCNLTRKITLIGNRAHIAEEKALGFSEVSWRCVLNRLPCEEVTIPMAPTATLSVYQEYMVLRSSYISNDKCVCANTIPIYVYVKMFL